MGQNEGVTSPTTTRPAGRAAGRPDAVCAAAVDLARAAAQEDAGDRVGEHLGAAAEGERLVTHLFAADEPGYRGWQWAVTVARVARSKHVTVCEVVLLPGDEALLPPEWLPWDQRLRPGDLGVGDLMPTAPDDDRLVPAYVLSDDPAVEEVAYELGLGRVRVLGLLGRDEIAERWHTGDAGPTADIAKAAPATCGTCGFYLPLAGSMRAAFGACGNLFAPDDGRVVTVDHGCGAHSEVLVEPVPPPVLPPVLDDDADLEVVGDASDPSDLPRDESSVEDSAPAEDLGHS